MQISLEDAAARLPTTFSFEQSELFERHPFYRATSDTRREDVHFSLTRMWRKPFFSIDRSSVGELPGKRDENEKKRKRKKI